MRMLRSKGVGAGVKAAGLRHRQVASDLPSKLSDWPAMAPQSLCSLIARRLLGARSSHAIGAVAGAAGSGTAIAKALEDTVATNSQSTSQFTKLQAHQTRLGSGPCLIPVSHPSVGLPSQYQLRLFSTTSGISDRISGGSGKDNRIEFTPISKAVALLVSHDALKDRHRIVTSMSKLCLDMASDIKQYSPTEVAAFCEAAKKLDFCTQALADAVMDYFQGKVDQLSEEELLGVIWVVAKKEDVDSLLARDLGEAVNNHLENLRHEDFPDMLVLISSLCPASPFLLTALSDEAMSRLQEFSQAEVCALVNAFGTEIVRRSLFDDRIFKELATHVVKNVRDFTQTELRSVLAVYRDVCPRRHSLVPTLALMEDELAPYTSPSPQ